MVVLRKLNIRHFETNVHIGFEINWYITSTMFSWACKLNLMLYHYSILRFKGLSFKLIGHFQLFISVVWSLIWTKSIYLIIILMLV